MKHLLDENSKPLAILFLALLTLLGFIAFRSIFPNNSIIQDNQKKQSTVSAKKYQNEYSLNNTIIGKVTQIDKINRIVTLETLEGRKQQYKVKIAENIVMSRPSPIKEGDDPKTVSYPPIVAKFEDLRIGSVLSVLSKEDPKLTSDLTALEVEVLV